MTRSTEGAHAIRALFGVGGHDFSFGRGCRNPWRMHATMANGPRMKAARNIIAGVLFGYGFVSFLCFLVLSMMWAGAAPRQPNEALGLIYRHNVHGSYSYFSAFQATACWLMFTTSIPLAFAGLFLAPKKNVTGMVRWYGARFRWDPDDPGALMKWAAITSAVATPFFVFFIGSYIIRGLNEVGFVMNLG